MKAMSVVLPVVAIAGAAFTGGASLGLLGADAAGTAALGAGAADSLDLLDAGSDLADMGDFEAVDTAANAATAPTIFSTVSGAFNSASPYLKAAAGGAQILGTVTGAEQAKTAASDQASLDTYEANIDTQNANTALASGSAAVQQQTRETAYALSNARAAAAAGGGSATDPTVTSDMMTIAGQGRLRAMTALYNAQTAEQSDLNAAAGARVGAQVAEQTGDTKEFTTILSGASSLYDKYGNPNSNNNNYSSLPPWVPQGAN